MRDNLSDSDDRPRFRLAHVAVTGLVLLLIVCLGVGGGYFSYQSTSEVGESGPQSQTLQGNQPFAVVRHPELLVRLWQGEKLKPQSGVLPESPSDEYICTPVAVGACPHTASTQPAIYISLPAHFAQVVSPRQPRAPPQALSI